MLLKRVFDHSSGEPVLDHVKVLRAKDIQHFSTKFLEQQMASGLVSINNGVITLNTVPELKFKIVRGPGYYVVFDNHPVADAAEARTYIEANFKGQPSPDESNPAGYRKDNFYACERIS